MWKFGWNLFDHHKCNWLLYYYQLEICLNYFSGHPAATWSWWTFLDLNVFGLVRLFGVNFPTTKGALFHSQVQPSPPQVRSISDLDSKTGDRCRDGNRCAGCCHIICLLEGPVVVGWVSGLGVWRGGAEDVCFFLVCVCVFFTIRRFVKVMIGDLYFLGSL